MGEHWRSLIFSFHIPAPGKAISVMFSAISEGSVQGLCPVLVGKHYNFKLADNSSILPGLWSSAVFSLKDPATLGHKSLSA